MSGRGLSSPDSPVRSQRPGVLEMFRQGLALFRRAGLPWWDAERVARDAALSVEPDEEERDEWGTVLYDTRTVWMRAYERRELGATAPIEKDR